MRSSTAISLCVCELQEGRRCCTRESVSLFPIPFRLHSLSGLRSECAEVQLTMLLRLSSQDGFLNEFCNEVYPDASTVFTGALSDELDLSCLFCAWVLWGSLPLGGFPPLLPRPSGFFGVLSGLALLFLVPLLACCCCPSQGSCYGLWGCLVASSALVGGLPPPLVGRRLLPSFAPYYPGCASALV